MSVSYGRYVITFDREEQEWTAEPKGKHVTISDSNGKVQKNYTYPASYSFAAPSREGLMKQMRNEGVTDIHCRHHEWVARMGS
jgi:hypothetical protein